MGLTPSAYRGRRLRPDFRALLLGELVSGEAWRLDAFSAYPFRT